METTAATATPSEAAGRAASAGRLWLYGLAMLLPAGYFALRYPLRGNTDQLLDIGLMADYRVEEFVCFVAGVGLLFALYVLGVRECRRLPPERARPAVFGVGGLLAAVFAWMYPVNAIDVFIYAVRSRLWTEYGQNPSAVRPVEFWETDPYVHFAMAEWADDTSPYGPLWNLAAAPATLLGGDDLGVALAIFKVLAVACVLLGGWAIYGALEALRPEDAATGALIYLWSPLVLWEGVANAHNDVLLALLLLLALLAWARRWFDLVVPLLIAAALVKYVGLLLVPLAAVALWRRTPAGRARWVLALRSAAWSLLVCLVAFAPFYDVRAVVESVERQGELISTSPAGMAIGRLEDYVAEPTLTDAVKLVGIAIVMMAVGWFLADVWLRPERLPRAGFEVVFWFLLAATWNFRGWYLVWPVALVALLPVGWPFWRVLAWTAGGLLVYGHYIWFWHWWWDDYEVYRDVGVLIIFGPVAVVGLIEVAREVLLRARIQGPASPRIPESAGANPSR